jgi:antitoxin ParD1/3/4
MKIKGIKRGQSIKLLEEINNIPDGTEILVDLEIVPPQGQEPKPPLTDEERLAQLNKLFGAWKNQPALMAAFAEIDEQRHAYQGREIDKG